MRKKNNKKRQHNHVQTSLATMELTGERNDEATGKNEREKKEYITWEDNVINYSSDSKKKIISLGIMMKDYENGEEQSRYIDSNFSKHMACIKVYSYFSPR